MKTPSQHNIDKTTEAVHNNESSVGANVCCPKCLDNYGKQIEMIFDVENTLLLSDPPKKRVRCQYCNNTESILA